MNRRFKNVKVLIWDFDGTLYQWIPKLRQEVREAEYRTIMNHTGWSREKTNAEFIKLHEKTPSATETVARLCGIPTSQAAIEGEQYIDRSKYLHKDIQLIQLFDQLLRFSHYLLVNGIQSVTRESLKLLGIEPGIFSEIVTSEVVGENKPSEKGFRYILEKTKLPPHQHLMIGDREKVDLEPAKKLGIKTCLVWSDTPGRIADVTLSSVYDLAGILV